MGNLLTTCCGLKGEDAKNTAFQSNHDHEKKQRNFENDHTSNPSRTLIETQTDNDDETNPRNEERHRAYQNEQARLELIVSEVGQNMVTIGRARDSAYYDQAHAANVTQNLRKNSFLLSKNLNGLSCAIEGGLGLAGAGVNASSVLELLSKGRWEGIDLGQRGVDPDFFLDDCAESFLASVLPTKECLFQGVGQIVENLP